MTERKYFLLDYVKERYSLPADWEIYKWQALGPVGKSDAVQVSGAVAPLLTRGPRKGRRNWNKRDKASELAVAVPNEALKAYRLAWERQTGLCHECAGTTTVICGWSASEGTKYRPCTRCNATGKFEAAA